MQIVKSSIDFIVYNNIAALCATRQITLLNYAEYSMKDFDIQNEASGYFVINGERKAKMNGGREIEMNGERKAEVNESRKVYILYLTTRNATSKKDKIEKLLNSVHDDTEIILIGKKNIKLQKPNVEFIDSERYLMYNWAETFAARGSSLKILSHEQFKEECGKFLIDLDNLSPINSDSHECVWYGLKSDQIIKIYYVNIGSCIKSSDFLRVA